VFRMARSLIGLFLSFVFHLQIDSFLKWSREDSNHGPPPCKGGTVL
jgi:hypothetical protein